MKLYKPIKIKLLFYLSFAIMFPSYHGFENGHEFHFFEISESYAEYRHHDQSGIEASYDHEHPHSLLLFYPSYQLRKKSQTNGIVKVFLPGSINAGFTVADYHYSNILHTVSNNTYVYGYTTSGLAPPA